MKTEYPVGDHSPQLPETEVTSGSIITSEVQLETREQDIIIRTGQVYWDEDEGAYICKGKPNSGGINAIEDWVVPDGTEQVWVHANFSIPAETTRTNIFKQDGLMYYSGSSCSSTQSKDCRLLAQLLWGGSGQNRNATILNNIDFDPNLYGYPHYLSGYAKTSGLIRRF